MASRSIANNNSLLLIFSSITILIIFSTTYSSVDAQHQQFNYYALPWRLHRPTTSNSGINKKFKTTTVITVTQTVPVNVGCTIAFVLCSSSSSSASAAVKKNEIEVISRSNKTMNAQSSSAAPDILPPSNKSKVSCAAPSAIKLLN